MKDKVPKFTNKDEYATYKTKVDIWREITDVPEAKMAGTLMMELKEKPLEVAFTCDRTKLKTEKGKHADGTTVVVGVDHLLEVLDKMYISKEVLVQKYDEFKVILRKSDQGLDEFIQIFERKKDDLANDGLTIPDLILASELLRSANLPPGDEKLARVTCPEMSFKEVKESLLRFNQYPGTKEKALPIKVIKREFEETVNIVNKDEDVVLEDENEILYNNSGYRRGGNMNSSRGGYYSRGGHNNYRGGRNAGGNPGNDKNWCFGCGSMGHWVNDCPEMMKLPYYSYPRDLNVRPDQGQYNGYNNNQYRLRYNNQGYNQSRPNFQPRGRAQYQPRQQQYQSGNQGPYPTYMTSMVPAVDDSQWHYEYDDGQCNIEDPYRPIFFVNDIDREEEDIFLVGETIGHALLDTGASMTVCGENWYDRFIESIDEKEKSLVQENESEVVFKFGAGKLKAKKFALIPVTVFERDIMLQVHVVNSDIPLLISLKTMKNMGINLDCQSDVVTVRGKEFNVKMTTGGHYSIPINRVNEVDAESLKSIFIAEKMDSKKIADKLHRRFAHARSHRVIKLLKSAEYENSEEIEKELIEIDKTCQFCKKYKRAHPLPKVSLPLADSFNQLVAVDLKMIGDTWVLHCIDYVSRFSNAVIVENKTTEEITEKFLKIWISLFGTPELLYSDNGGEFVSDLVETLCTAFDITQATTPSESPFGNGVCERHNSLIGEMTVKLEEETGNNLEVCLMWALQAKNSLVNVNGFSPYQFVFGKNPYLPGVLTSRLPAMDDTNGSAIVAKHLNCMYKAREAFVQAECSARIKRALQGKIYQGTHQRFLTGDMIYYKREKSKGWLGPAKVLIQDGTKILIKSGGLIRRIHPCKCVLAEEAEKQMASNVDDITHNQVSRVSAVSQKDNEESDSSDSEDDEYIYRERDQTPEQSNNEVIDVELEEINGAMNEKGSPTGDDFRQGEVSEMEVEKDEDNSTSKNGNGMVESIQSDPSKIRKGDKIYIREVNAETWKEGTIESRAGKAKGANKDWWNVKVKNEGTTNFDFSGSSIDWFMKKAVDDSSINLGSILFAETIAHEIMVLNDCKSDEYLPAKSDEVKKWEKYDVFEKVNRREYPTEDVLSCRWVGSEVNDNGEVRYKARLVIRGYEEFNPPEADSPTASKSIMRLFLTLACTYQWKLEMLDVRAAFLQSKPIERLVLVRPPKEFRKNDEEVWRLKKAAYGLNDAARNWYNTIKKKLLELGCTMLKLDSSAYLFHDENGKLAGLVIVHVDDILLGGNEQFRTQVLEGLIKAFHMGTRNSSDEFKYIGWDIRQRPGGIEVNQHDYTDMISPLNFPKQSLKSIDPKTELNEKEKLAYQKLLGQLQWVTSQTRPDIRFRVLECSTKANKPCMEDVVRINKAVKKLKATLYNIKFCKFEGDLSDAKILVFGDASLHNLPDGVSSTLGYIVFLAVGYQLAPITWGSRKIQRIAKFIINAEFMALSKAVEESLVIRETMKEILGKNMDVLAYTDCQSLRDNIHSGKNVQDKQLRVEVAALRQRVEEYKEVRRVKWIKGTHQLADPLTKTPTAGTTGELIEVLRTGISHIDQDAEKDVRDTAGDR